MVGLGSGVFDAEFGAGVGPVVAAVAVAVVCEYSFDGDVVVGVEPVVGSTEERNAIGFVLDASELGIREPRIGIYGGVDVAVAGPLSAALFSLGGAPEFALPAAQRDSGKLFDVDVHEFAGPVGVNASNLAPWGTSSRRSPKVTQRWRVFNRNLASLDVAVTLIEAVVTRVARLEERRYAQLVGLRHHRCEYRAAQALVLMIRVGAKDAEIPVRFVGTVSLHRLTKFAG